MGTIDHQLLGEIDLAEFGANWIDLIAGVILAALASAEDEVASIVSGGGDDC